MNRPLWLVLTLAGLVSVWALNGGQPLYYFDTGGYIEQGKAALAILGMDTALPPGAGAGDSSAAEADTTVSGNRTILYPLALTLTGESLGYRLAALAQIMLVGGLIGLILLAIWRAVGLAASPARLGLPILAGCLGALPFYATFLMPDIFAPILILAAGALMVGADRLSAGWRAALVLVLTGAVITHISHLGIAFGLMLIAPLITLAAGAARPFLPALLIGLAVLGGLAERIAFGVLAQAVEGKTARYDPFLTTRLIADGPGLAYLLARCPATTEPACPLAPLLTDPAYPERQNATNMIFATKIETGSFRRLPEETRTAIANDQLGFALRVMVNQPLGVIRAVTDNSLRQLNRFGIRQTLPDMEQHQKVLAMADLPAAAIPPARLLAGNPMGLALTETAHRWVYAGAVGAILLGLALARAPRRIYVLVLALGAGIAVNALVCGALSQPSPRYGGRVVWLVLLGAAVIWQARPNRTAPPRPAA